MKIYQYPLKITDRNIIEIEKFCSILDVQLQGNELVLWAEVDSKVGFQYKMKIEVVIFGTGHTINENDRLKYFSTFQLDGFVGHVYYKQTILR